MATQPTPDYTLTGRVNESQGEPLEGLIVRAYNQDLKTPENVLGKDAVTDAEGRYKISLTERDFKVGGVESGGPDVLIRMHGGHELLGESPVRASSAGTCTIKNSWICAGQTWLDNRKFSGDGRHGFVACLRTPR